MAHGRGRALPSCVAPRVALASRLPLGSARNHYAVGRSWESVGYPVNGEADDWSYGTMGAVSLTMEVGNSHDSFWPTASRIAPIAEESVWPATYLALAAGPMLQLESVALRAPPPTAATATSTTATGADGSTRELALGVQANGLRSVLAGHQLCVCTMAGGGGAQLHASEGWSMHGSSPATLYYGARWLG